MSYCSSSDWALQRALNRYAAAVEGKAFQGTIPRYESDEAEAAWDAIDVELERARTCLENLMERRINAWRSLPAPTKR